MSEGNQVTFQSDQFAVRDLGRQPYQSAFDQQMNVLDAVVAGDAPETLLLVEHDPVITVSRRPGAADHLLAGAQRLAQMGIDVQPTNRGGDITYHGPGQLVAYPILHLGGRKLNIASYLRLLEEAVIQCLAKFDIEGHREEGLTGVWVNNAAPGGQSAKICAMGVRVRRNVSMHGLALNVTTDLSHFNTIVPCGLTGRAVTSLEKLLGDRCPTMDEVKHTLISQLNAQLAGHPRKSPPGES